MRENYRGECWSTLPDPDPGGQHLQAIKKYNLNYVRGLNGRDGLSGLPGMITYGANSGYQAIHLAYNLGASKIILLGYDYGGNSHFFGDHPQPLRSGHDYRRWHSAIKILADDLKAAGVEVINCSRQSTIKCFPRADIAEINFN